MSIRCCCPVHLSVDVPPPAPPEEKNSRKSISSAAEGQTKHWNSNHNREPESKSTLQEASAAGLFFGKSFLLVGFGTETEEQLSVMVTEHGGRVLTGRVRVVADYAVVPLLGCSVEATVDEVVTVTWLVRALIALCFTCVESIDLHVVKLPS